jgi:hypothetical protein
MAYKRTGRKLNIKSNTILNNIYILYFIFIIAVGNLFYLLIENNAVFVTLFVLIGFLTSFFSKNMIVILTTTMVFTNILKCGTGIRNTEGFKEEESEKDEKDGKVKNDKKDNKDGKDGMVPEINDDLDDNKINNEKKIIGKGNKGKSDNSVKSNQIIMDLAKLDDSKLDQLNNSLVKQKDILESLNSMTPVIKSLDAFTSTMGQK